MLLFWFIILYISSLAVPAVLYTLPLGGVYDAYSASVLCGTVAWAIFTNQVILASRPRFAVLALGTRPLLAFHGIMAVAGLGIAITHRILKLSVGFTALNLQTSLGFISLTAFFLSILIAFLLMSPAYFPAAKALRGFRDYLMERTPLTYRFLRSIHSLTVPLLLFLLAHVLLASTAQFSVNPAAFIWMVLWTITAFVFYIRYRLRGRQSSKVLKELIHEVQ